MSEYGRETPYEYDETGGDVVTDAPRQVPVADVQIGDSADLEEEGATEVASGGNGRVDTSIIGHDYDDEEAAQAEEAAAEAAQQQAQREVDDAAAEAAAEQAQQQAEQDASATATDTTTENTETSETSDEPTTETTTNEDDTPTTGTTRDADDDYDDYEDTDGSWSTQDTLIEGDTPRPQARFQKKTYEELMKELEEADEAARLEREAKEAEEKKPDTEDPKDSADEKEQPAPPPEVVEPPEDKGKETTEKEETQPPADTPEPSTAPVEEAPPAPADQPEADTQEPAPQSPADAADAEAEAAPPTDAGPRQAEEAVEPVIDTKTEPTDIGDTDTPGGEDGEVEDGASTGRPWHPADFTEPDGGTEATPGVTDVPDVPQSEIPITGTDVPAPTTDIPQPGGEVTDVPGTGTDALPSPYDTAPGQPGERTPPGTAGSLGGIAIDGAGGDAAAGQPASYESAAGTFQGGDLPESPGVEASGEYGSAPTTPDDGVGVGPGEGYRPAAGLGPEGNPSTVAPADTPLAAEPGWTGKPKPATDGPLTKTGLVLGMIFTPVIKFPSVFTTTIPKKDGVVSQPDDGGRGEYHIRVQGRKGSEVMIVKAGNLNTARFKARIKYVMRGSNG